MSVIHNDLLLSTDEATGYNLTKSLRFRSAAGGYLNRTPTTTGNRRTWTWSAWVKRGTLGVAQDLFSASETFGNNNNTNEIAFTASNTLDVFGFASITGTIMDVNTTQVFRDTSAWYHIIVAIDTTQATAANRVKIYVNGTQVTAFGTATYPSQNYDLWTNVNNMGNYVGRWGGSGGASYFDGYMAELNFVDGQALTPSSFGENDLTTGVWKPKRYTGTYGTNGFYLPFTDVATTSGSNAGLGKDFSGNGNYWNTNNISVTTGTTYDSMTDVPTLTSATAANYVVLNPLSYPGIGSYLSNANLKISGQDQQWVMGTIGVSTGKWYWEVNVPTATYSAYVGIINTPFQRSDPDTVGLGSTANLASYVGNNNYKDYTSSSTTSQSGTTQNTVWGIALDLTAGTISYYVANSLYHTDSTLPTDGSKTFFPMNAATNSGSNSWTANSYNFGQQGFTYTPPTGFKALNTYNLPDSTIVAGNKYMDATLYNGIGGGTQSITNAGGFKPDFVWTKLRSGSGGNFLNDSVRGAANLLGSETTGAEQNLPNYLTAFNSNGFSLGTSSYTSTGNAVVGWQWQAGQGSTSSNTSGSITSTVSVNASAGFSIVTYTGTGSAATVGHGLGVAPKMIICKVRSGTGFDWNSYHVSLGATQYINLNTTAAAASASSVWNNTTPTSSVFSVANNGGTNGNGETLVAYCWSEIAGFSKFGSYTGNGSADGPFVYTGFRPKYVMVKRIDSTGDWIILDTSRDGFNLSTKLLYPNASTAEETYNLTDLISNGFKQRNTFAALNASGGSYIYMAFAEVPFKNSLGR